MARPRRQRPVLRAGRTVALALPLLGAAALAGCAAPGQLVASDGSHRLQAQHQSSGLTVILTTEAWDGHPDVPRDVTVVHVLVANQGDEPILLAPGDFDLRDRRGFRYDLLDPGVSFSTTTGAPLGGPAPYDPGMATSYRTLSSFDDEVAQSALAWGVLLPGMHMRGFLYFEPIEDAANGARLTWHAETPGHSRVADLVFEMGVARKGAPASE